MKRFTSMFVLLLFLSFSLSTFLVPNAEATEDSWTTMADIPTPRLGPGVAVVNGKIYVIAGSANYEYNPATDTWAAKKPMPTSRFHFGIAVYQNKIYVIGGTVDYTWQPQEEGKYCSANEVYDPLTDTWETKASMLTNRSRMQANVVNDKIYLIGGSISDEAITVVNEAYDPVTDSWETKTPMPTKKEYFDAIVVENKIYCIGGFPNQDGPDYLGLDRNEVYDPATDSWTTKTPIPIPVYSYESAVVDNKIYIIGGGPFASSQNQIYDTENDTWTSGKNLPITFHSAAVGVTTGIMAPKRIYLMGFMIGFALATNSNYMYDPTADDWINCAPMPTSRYGLEIAVVNDILYAIGGAYDLPHLSAAVEQYTPFGFGTVPPEISVVSPENKTYTVNMRQRKWYMERLVPLTFTVSEPTSWIGYSLDGQANVTISGNTTLHGLSDGLHILKVYAKDTAGNVGTSETIYFSIKTQQSEPFPIIWIVAAIAIIAVAGVALLVYFAKVKKTTGKVE